MPVDHIRYDILVQEALRGMVRDVLTDAAKNKGLPGEHHFFITFDTTAEGVQLSHAAARAISGRNDDRAAAPVLGSQGDRRGVRGRPVVRRRGRAAASCRSTAIKAFADPSVQFTLQFETLAETPDEDAERGRDRNRTAGRQAADAAAPRTRAPQAPVPRAFRRARFRRLCRRR